MKGSKIFVFAIVILFSCITFATAANEFKDIDCGWSSMTKQQCLDKGCYWLEGFKGPWCHKPNSPHIPSYFDQFNINKISSDQYEILQITVISFVVLSIFSILGSKKTFFLDIDYLIVGILFIISWTTRYHHIEHPKEVVFDEYYFGDFANSYCNQLYVFDIHPPLAKLTHYYFGQLMGVKCTMDFHANEGLEKYTSYDQYVPYRLISAFFGTLCVPLAYLIGRKLNFSTEISIVLSCLVLCDSLLLSETRLVLTDSQLFFYIILSIYCALQLWNSDENTFSRKFWLLATAVSSGCAFGVKFTALATLAWIAFITFIGALTDKKPIGFFSCVIASIVSAIVFVIPFYFHIALGKRNSETSWNLDIDHQKLLIGNPHYDPRAIAPSFPSHLIYLIKRMLEQNAASLGDHPYASYWYEWVLGKGSLLSYAEHDYEKDWHGHIFIVSNDFICYSILIAMFLFFPISLTFLRGRLLFRLNAKEKYFLKLGFLIFLGWVANLVPYALVARTTYSYHYLPGQFFGMLMICLLFDVIPYFLLSTFVKPENLPSKLHYLRVFIAILYMFGLFWQYYFYSAFSYGFGLNSADYNSRKWAVGGV